MTWNDLEPSTAEYDLIGQRIIERATGWDASQRLRRRIAVGAAAATLAIGGIGAAWVSLANPALRTGFAYCFSDSDPSSTYVGAGTGTDGADSDPVELCEAVWRIGAVGPHATEPPVDGIEYDVPPLTACDRLDGIVAVFPNTGGARDEAFCRSLGLAPHD